MYYIKNITTKFNKITFKGKYFNSFQYINLPKHSIYPNYNRTIMMNNFTNIIVNSGKLMIHLISIKKEDKTLISKTLFAEKNILYEIINGNEIIITNTNYLITINPNIYFSFYSYDNSNFNIYLKLKKYIKYYSIHNNKLSLSSIEYL